MKYMKQLNQKRKNLNKKQQKRNQNKLLKQILLKHTYERYYQENTKIYLLNIQIVTQKNKEVHLSLSYIWM